MTDSQRADSVNSNGSGTNSQSSRIIYRERQWVPWYWWLAMAFVVALLTAQFGLNRSDLWIYIPAVLLSIIAVWVMLSMSNTIIRVEEDSDGTRWLIAGQANLPNDVVSRSLAVPATAKRNAMGRQLDPAAFVVSHGWVHEMIMLVLDDPEDPTPYWLIGTRDPESLLRAFVPDQADGALTDFN